MRAFFDKKLIFFATISLDFRSDHGFCFKLDLGQQYKYLDTIVHVLFAGSHVQGSPQVFRIKFLILATVAFPNSFSKVLSVRPNKSFRMDIIPRHVQKKLVRISLIFYFFFIYFLFREIG